MSIPQDFRDAVEKAANGERAGDLRLLSWEIHDLPWAADGQYLAASVKIAIQHEPSPGRILLFAGHLVDPPGRPQPRFPPAGEETARRAIRAAILADRDEAGQAKLGLAGAASGGDILFHEICAELGIPTHVYLPFGKEAFLDTSVRPAGGDWVKRFERLTTRRPCFQLSDSRELPGWLAGKADYDVWLRANRWMVHNAFAESDDDVGIIALWDRDPGNSDGVTADLVNEAVERGATPRICDTRRLFGL